MFTASKFSWKWYFLPAIVFAVIVSFNFTKPFGFFRESNPALVAINAEYWKENADIRKQNIPIASYAFDKTKPASTQFDNTITTFGFAWFSVPYCFLQVTGIPASPTGLRIFSVLWLLLTVFAVSKLAQQLVKFHTKKKWITFVTVLLYVLSPAVLWYQVNGYVHETAVLPFYYSAWYCYLKLLEEKKIKWLWLTAIFLFTGIQFDWLPFFQGMVMSGYIFFSRKTQMQKWMFLIPGLAVAAGIGYILFTYTSWASANDYFSFMRWKFGSRTVGQEGHSFLSFWPAKLNILLFYLISYGILLWWSAIGLSRKKMPPLLFLMIITGLLHHLVFWGFSSEHDYATLKMAFPIVFLAATAILQMKKTTAIISVLIISILAIIQYFVLHNYSYRKGMYQDDQFFVKAGNLIKQQPSGQQVFIDTERKYFPQVEFYAGRPYKMATSVEDAKQQLEAGSFQNGIFIDVYSGKATLIK